MNTVYSDRMADATDALPPAASEPARDSIGAALAVATRLGGPPAEPLALAARNAFVDAFGVASLVGAGVIVVGAAVVARYLPARELGPADGTATDPAGTSQPTSGEPAGSAPGRSVRDGAPPAPLPTLGAQARGATDRR